MSGPFDPSASALHAFLGRLRWSRRARRRALVVAGAGLLVAAWIVVSLLWSAVAGPEVLRHLSVLGGAGWCEEQPIACSVSKSLLTALAVFVVGLAGFVWWRRRALTAYGKRARESPERLFDWVPSALAPPRTLGRDNFIETIIGNLRGSVAAEARAQVIRGDSGSGKTTLLIELTRRLGREGVLPVPLSLRNTGTTVDIVELAKAQFAAAVDADVSGKDRAARLWRQLCQEGRVVVLADGLDEVTTGSALQRDEAARRALEKARRRDVGLIVTTRAAIWRSGVDAAVYSLPELPEDLWLAFIEDRVTSPPTAEQEARIREFIEAAALGGRPVYLLLVARLFDLAAPALQSLLEESSGALSPASARWRLLDAYTDAVRRSALSSRSPVGEAAIAQVMDHLSWVACGALLLNSREPTLADVAEEVKGFDAAPTERALEEALDGASQLAFVHVRQQDEHIRLRFAQADLQSYFAAALLESRKDVVAKLLAQSFTAEFGAALALYCRRPADPGVRSREICDALIERATAAPRGLPDDARLPSLATAADIAVTAGIGVTDGLRAEIAREAWRAWSGAAHASRLGALPCIRDLRVAASYETLWEITREQHYDLRLAAAVALMQEAGEAHRSLAAQIHACMAIVDRPGSWNMTELHKVSVLGWVLPSWVSLAGDGAPELGRHLRRLVDVATRPPVHVAFEASLAQGFKLDALERPDGAIDARVRDLQPVARFWYSTIALVHALTIRAVTTRDDSARPDLERLTTDTAAHPFARRAAELGLRALDAGQWKPFVWADEAASIVTDGAELHPDTAQLLGDVVVTLNLTERGDWSDRAAEIQEHYTKRYLPHCLSTSPSREELRTRCPGPDGPGPSCEFGLCPYPPPWGTGARGDFSQAFCRARRDGANARRLRARPFVASAQLPWQPAIDRDALGSFWEWMDQRVEP